MLVLRSGVDRADPRGDFGGISAIASLSAKGVCAVMVLYRICMCAVLVVFCVLWRFAKVSLGHTPIYKWTIDILTIRLIASALVSPIFLSVRSRTKGLTVSSTDYARKSVHCNRHRRMVFCREGKKERLAREQTYRTTGTGG